MSLELNAARSRRTVLAAAAGAAAATVVAAIDHPFPVQAVTDGDVVLGAENAATTTTEIHNTTNDEVVFAARSTGHTNVILGTNEGDGIGVAGMSESGHGIEGTSTAGMGVVGTSGTGTGVLGNTDNGGFGVHGHSDGPGVGVYATTDVGTALEVVGKARFNRSGRASIPAGKSWVDVDLSAKGGLHGTPLCFATLTSYRAGTWVVAVQPNQPSSGWLRIRLNRAVTTSTWVAWVVLA